MYVLYLRVQTVGIFILFYIRFNLVVEVIKITVPFYANWFDPTALFHIHITSYLI